MTKLTPHVKVMNIVKEAQSKSYISIYLCQKISQTFSLRRVSVKFVPVTEGIKNAKYIPN